MPVAILSLSHPKNVLFLLHVHAVPLFGYELRLAPVLLSDGEGVSGGLCAVRRWNVRLDHLHHPGMSRVASRPLYGRQLHDVSRRVREASRVRGSSDV